MAGQFNLKFNGKLGWPGEGKDRQGNVAQLMLLSKATRATATTTEQERAGKDIVITVSRHATHSDTALLPWSLAGNHNSNNNEEENHLVRGEIKRRRNAVLQLCS